MQGYLNTPLVVAAACGHMNVVAWCIEQKVKLNTPEVHGWTALHLAALKVRERNRPSCSSSFSCQGHAEIAEALVKAGLDATIKDLEGKTARELAANPPDWVPSEPAAVEGRAKIVKLLSK